MQQPSKLNRGVRFSLPAPLFININMNDAVILSHSLVMSRYAGPYVAANSARKAGYQVKVLDYFLHHDNIEEYIKPHVGPNTKLLAISSTFIYRKTKDRHTWYNILMDEMTCLHCDSKEQLKEWFASIRKVIPKDCKIAIAGERVNRIYEYWPYIPEDHPLKTSVDLYFLGRDDDALYKFLSDNYRLRKEKFIFDNQSNFFATADIPNQIYTDKDCIIPQEVLSIEISRGCAFNCKYCNYDKATVNKKQMQAIENDFNYYYEKFGVSKYHFTTECFNDNIGFVREFHNLTKRLDYKLNWVSYARPDLCWKYPEVPELMLESGAIANFYGVETMNHEAAKFSGRGLHFDKIMKVFEKFKSLDPNYMIHAFFIIGLPKDTIKSIISFGEWISKQNIIDSAKFEVLGIMPLMTDAVKLWHNAEYAVDPKKYGFNEVRFYPDFYWKHDTMNHVQAVRLYNYIQDKCKENPYLTGPVLDIVNLMAEGIDRSDYKNKSTFNNDIQEKILTEYFDRIQMVP